MKLSQLLAPTLKEDPSDAEVISHKLMIRAGMIRQVARGIYDFLPLGLRAVRRFESIVREEMNRAGAQEILMPAICPAELWQESGRWSKYGPELLRLKDLLGLSLEELKALVEAEGARAELRREWHGGVEDPVRRHEILEESLGHIARQLDLVRRRRDEIAKLEAELVARRKRVRGLLRELSAA